MAARFDQFDQALHAMLAVQMTGGKFDHYFEQQLPASHPQMTDRQKALRRENRLGSVWFGASHLLKQRAYRRALTLAGWERWVKPAAVGDG